MGKYGTRSKTNGTLLAPLNPILFEYPPDAEADSTKGVIAFTRHDHKLLTPPSFLNDTIISFFMQYHLDHCVSQGLKDRIHVFNSFFFAKIKSLRSNNSEGNSYSCASRWLKGVTIFNKDFLIMPVCERDHWILVVVCYPDKTPSSRPDAIPDCELYEPAVIVLNSSHGYAPSVKKTLNQFLRFQWHIERKELRTFAIQQAKPNGIRLLFPGLPQQKNTWNCGVYALNYFHCFLKDPRGTYVKMYRQEGLNDWFARNKEVILDRRIMKEIIKEQIDVWNKSPNKAKRLAQESQDVLIESSSQSSSSPYMMDGDEEDSIIVIR